MNLSKYALVALALTLAACSGNFSSGTGMPSQIPPVGASNPPPYGTNGMPENAPSELPSASPVPTYSPGTYALSEAAGGFECPSTKDGYACEIRFNIPPATPTPAAGRKGKGAAAETPSPSPSPTPTPTPTPTDTPSENPSGSPSPSASSSPSKNASPTIALKAQAMPEDAPPMYHTPPNTLDVVPLMLVRLTPNTDFALDGAAQASFTLPKEQVAQRGFAVQLFHETGTKKRTSYTPIWTFDKSSLKDDTLTFDFTPPKMTIAKSSTYVLVLYGDDKSKAGASPSPAASSSPAPSATPAASPSP
jgi:hypothetical protein